MASKWISLAEASRILGIAPNTIRRLVERGTLPAFKIQGVAGYRFQREQVEALIQSVVVRPSRNKSTGRTQRDLLRIPSGDSLAGSAENRRRTFTLPYPALPIQSILPHTRVSRSATRIANGSAHCENPCPCGYHGDPVLECTSSLTQSGGRSASKKKPAARQVRCGPLHSRRVIGCHTCTRRFSRSITSRAVKVTGRVFPN